MIHAQQFEAFLHKYQNMVFSIAMRLLANPAEAEDVSQETFLKAFRHFEELRDNPSAPGWLKTVATHLSLNHIARYRSRWTVFSDLHREDSDEPAQPEFPAGQTGDEELDKADRAACIEQALRGLPDSQRVPLVLYHFEGFTYDQIASKLGVSLGKIKTDIFRGREALRKKLLLKLQPEQPS